MDFSIETQELQNIIKLLGVTAKINTQDIRERVLIEAREDGGLFFLSNSMDTAIAVESDKAEIRTPGSVSVIYNKLKSFAMSFNPWSETYGAKDFTFKIEDINNVNVSVDNVYKNGRVSKGKLKLRQFPAHTIPVPQPFEQPNFILNSSILKTAIAKVVYAIDPIETKKFIQGMNMRFDDDDIYFAGTDGRVLSEYKVKNVSDLKEGNYILTYSFIMGLRRAVSDDAQLFIEIDGRNIKVKFDNVCFYGRIVIGHEYPDYAPALTDFENEITLDKDILMSCLVPFSDVLDVDDYNRLTISIADKNINFYNDSAKFTYEGEVDYEDSFIIDVDGKLVMQTVDAIKDDKIIIRFSDDKGNLIFDSGNFEDQKALVTHIRRR